MFDWLYEKFLIAWLMIERLLKVGNTDSKAFKAILFGRETAAMNAKKWPLLKGPVILRIGSYSYSEMMTFKDDCYGMLLHNLWKSC